MNHIMAVISVPGWLVWFLAIAGPISIALFLFSLEMEKHRKRKRTRTLCIVKDHVRKIVWEKVSNKSPAVMYACIEKSIQEYGYDQWDLGIRLEDLQEKALAAQLEVLARLTKEIAFLQDSISQHAVEYWRDPLSWAASINETILPEVAKLLAEYREADAGFKELGKASAQLMTRRAAERLFQGTGDGITH